MNKKYFNTSASCYSEHVLVLDADTVQYALTNDSLTLYGKNKDKTKEICIYRGYNTVYEYVRDNTQERYKSYVYPHVTELPKEMGMALETASLHDAEYDWDVILSDLLDYV